MLEEPQSVRNRAAPQEAALEEGSRRIQVGEAEVRDLARKLEKMHECLEEVRLEAQCSASIAEQSLKELMNLTERLAEAEELTDSATAVATSFQLQCEILSRELEERNSEVQHWRFCKEILKQELGELQNNMKQKVPTHKPLRYEAEDLAAHVEMALERTYVPKECEFQKLLEEVSTQNIKHLEMQLLLKNEEIARLSQKLEKQRTEDEDLQKKMLRVELCLGEAQREIRKLKKSLEEQENHIQCSQMWLQETKSSAGSPSSFWSNFTLPGLLSVSAIVVLCIIKP